MKKKVALLTVHGMGETPPNYNSDLKSAIRERLGELADGMHVGSVYYQHILQPNEYRVWRKVEKKVVGPCNGLWNALPWYWVRRNWWNELRQFLLFGFGDAAGLESGKESRDSVYTQAQICFAKALFSARQNMDGDGPVVIIAQSLGCQVSSCYFWDAQLASDGSAINVGIWRDIQSFSGEIISRDQGLGGVQTGREFSNEEIRFLQGRTFRTLITTGCNIPIFVAAHAKSDIIPIFAGDKMFQWHNYFDPDDVLGWPLSPLSQAYGERVKDYAINASGSFWGWIGKSWNPLSHTQYWSDVEVLDQLETQLRQFLEPKPGETQHGKSECIRSAR